MQRTTSLFLAALCSLATMACDSAAPDKAKTAQAKADKAGPKPEAAKHEPTKDGAAKAEPSKDEAAKAEPSKDDAAKPAGAWEAKLESRVLADSGLGVGGKLSAFDIINCESGETYCQVCKFGGSPKIMAVGTAEDAKFRDDLKNLDAIAKKYEGNDVKAFAVITDIVEGKATAPADPKALQDKADAIRKELALTIPVVVPAPQKEGADPVWTDYYNITASRTVMFSDGENNVTFSAVAPDDFAGLATEIDKVVGAKAG